MKVYGSYKTGLAMPWSDIDLGLTLVKGIFFPENVLGQVYLLMGKFLENLNGRKIRNV